MKKDKISLFVLVIEIVAIVAMHATKNNADQLAAKPANSQSSPIFSASTVQTTNNNTYLILPGYPY